MKIRVDPCPEKICQSIRIDNYEFSLHAEQEREDEHILVEELGQSIASGELLEDYPDDPSPSGELTLTRSLVER